MKQLGIFARYWLTGRVKTRLAAVIGTTGAAGWYRRSLQTLVWRFRETADRRVLGFWPANRRAAFERLAGRAWQLSPQVDGDLGRRLAAYFHSAFQRGADRVVLIGADSPTLPLDFVTAAFAALQTNEVVLGPAIDGGYYLIGARARVPPVFESIRWSQPDVWQQTTERLECQSIRWAALPEWYDVDEIDDLLRLRAELFQPAFAGPQWDPLREATRRGFKHRMPPTL